MENIKDIRRIQETEMQIHQQAGNHATLIGKIEGDLTIYKNIYNYYANSDSIGDEDVDVIAYTNYLQAEFSIWKQRYSLLDVDVMVSLVGQDFQAIPDTQTTIVQAIEEHNRLFILGNAGSGKTTSLYFIAQEFAQKSLIEHHQNSEKFSPVGLYIDLGRFRMPSGMSALQSLLILIAEVLYLGKASSRPISLNAVQDFLSRHQCIFLLDGLNEIPLKLRNECLRAIDDLAHRYAENQYIITTRPYDFSPLQDWEVVALRELNETQIDAFLTRYADAETTKNLLQTILDSQNPFIRLPLFLTFILKMREIPLAELQAKIQSKSGIVDSYVKYLIERDKKEKHLVEMYDFPKEQIYKTLYNLSHIIQQTGQALTTDEALTILAEQHILNSAQEASNILKHLYEQGLLSLNDGYVRFWHHTLQEYFYAGFLTYNWRIAEKNQKQILDSFNDSYDKQLAKIIPFMSLLIYPRKKLITYCPMSLNIILVSLFLGLMIFLQKREIFKR